MARRLAIRDSKTQRRNGTRLIWLAGLLCLPAAHAADFGLAIGAGPARARVDCLDGLPCDRSGNFAKVTASYRLDSGVELRGSYFHAGTFKGRDVTPGGTVYGGDFKTNALGLTAGYGWRFAPGWRLSGRAGFALVRTGFDYDSPFSGSVDKTTLQPLAGIGLSYALTPQLGIGVEYDESRFKVHETHGSLRMPSVSLQYTF